MLIIFGVVGLSWLSSQPMLSIFSVVGLSGGDVRIEPALITVSVVFTGDVSNPY